jgi:hypothetical protein
MIRFLPIPLLAAILLPLNAANPVRNASFELGCGDWDLVRFSRQDTVFRDAVSDASNPVHGTKSLRIENPDADTIELSGREVLLKKNHTYTLSWYAKSSRPLRFRGAMVAENRARQWFVYTSFVNTTAEWKRYQCTFTAQESCAFIPKFIWGNWNGTANSATLWLDAVQLEEGTKPTQFRPYRDTELCAALNSRLSFDKQPLTVTVKAVNYTAQEKTLPLHIQLNDTVFPLPAHRLTAPELIIPANSTASLTLPLVPDRYGHMRLSEKRQLFTSLFFAVIPKPAALPFHPSVTAAGLEYDFAKIAHTHTKLPDSTCLMGANQEAHLAFFRNSGISLLRVGNLGTAFSWNRIETSPGNFDWREIDRQTALAEKYGLGLMAVLGNMFYLRDRPWGKRSWSRIPGFVIRNGKRYQNPKQKRWDGVLPDRGDWRNYVAAFAAHCKGKIAAYEITNEPNITIRAEDYVEYVKIAAQEIRRADPAAQVIGGSLTADYDGKLGHYLSLLNSSGALAACDALSFHPYSSRLDSSNYPAAANIRYLREKTNGKALWNSELYYLWDPPKQLYNNEAVLFSGMKPSHLFRRFTIDFGEGVTQSLPLSVNHLLTADGDRSWQGSPTFLSAALIPNAMYATYASAAFLFSGCRREKRLETPENITAYRFRHRNGVSFTVCWKKPNTGTAGLALPRKTEVRDLFGNPVVHHGTLNLTESPLVLYLPETAQIHFSSSMTVSAD